MLIDITKFNKATESMKRQQASLFNQLFEEEPNETLIMTPQQFKQALGKFEVFDWVEFLSDYRVDAVINKMIMINTKFEYQRLLQDKSLSSSPGASQRIKVLSDLLDKHFSRFNQTATSKIVLMAAPLSKAQRKAEGAKILVIKQKENPYNPSKEQEDD